MASFTFICGDDEYLVQQQAKAAFTEAAKDCDDEFSEETIEGGAQTVDEVATTVANTIQSAQTLSLFGGKKAIWLRGVSFLSDKRPGNSEGAKAEVEKLQAFLKNLDPETVSLIISAWPVDRRRKEFKWFQKNGDCTDIKSGPEALVPLLKAECETHKTAITQGAVTALTERVGGNSRLLVEEVRKLCAYLASEDTPKITETLVGELVPSFGEGDFFEVTEAFYALDLPWTLDALRRHFFIHSDARGIISSLQNRNRLLIQLRALIDARAISIGHRGIDKGAFERAASTYSSYYGEALDKSSFNVFTQNLWYLGNKVGVAANALTMKKLIGIQEALLEAFEGILSHPKEQHNVMNALAVKCLG